MFRWSGSNDGTSQKRQVDLSELSSRDDSTRYVRFDRSHALHIKMTSRPTAEQGSILLWIKPDWTIPREHSKPLLTMRWNDPRHSYLAISEGWWEPTGEHQLYFVISNQEYATCTSDTHLKPGYWSLIGVTWKAGVNGSCAIYINGEAQVQSAINMSGHYQGSGELIIGDDSGSTDQRGRSAEGWLAELQWHARVLNAADMLNAFERTLGGHQQAVRYRWQWLMDAINKDATNNVVAPKNEVRALFDESNEWARSYADADRILAQIHAAGFNVYVPCVWHGAGAYYPTRIAQVSRDIGTHDATYDALAYLVDHAHKLGIEVHPWITVARRDDRAHPEYAEAGTPPEAYDVHNSAFRKFIVNLATEVLQHYAVDGINLDYIRSMGMCTSGSCATDYRQKTGRELGKDIDIKDHDSVAYQHLVRWQDEAVADIVSGIKQARDRYRPAAIVSVDGNVQVIEATRSLQGRNEIEWLRSGLVDVVFDMDYESNLNIERLDKIFAAIPHGRVIPIYANFDRQAGVAVSRPGWAVDRLVRLTRKHWSGTGVAFYIRGMLNVEQQRALSTGVFSGPAASAWRIETLRSHDCVLTADCMEPK